MITLTESEAFRARIVGAAGVLSEDDSLRTQIAELKAERDFARAVIAEAQELASGSCWRAGCECKGKGYNHAGTIRTLDEAERRVAERLRARGAL